MQVKDSVGVFGEEVATGHLIDDGFEVVERNWRCDAGEIDIVAIDGDTVVVVEVKTRSSPEFGTGLEAVTPTKGKRLRRLALRYLDATDRSGQPVRVDVVAVHRFGDEIDVHHVRGAF